MCPSAGGSGDGGARLSSCLSVPQPQCSRHAPQGQCHALEALEGDWRRQSAEPPRPGPCYNARAWRLTMRSLSLAVALLPASSPSAALRRTCALPATRVRSSVMVATPVARRLFPGVVRCAYYDRGGEGVAYHDSDTKNNGSGALNPAGRQLPERVPQGRGRRHLVHEDAGRHRHQRLQQGPARGEPALRRLDRAGRVVQRDRGREGGGPVHRGPAGTRRTAAARSPWKATGGRWRGRWR